MLWSVRIADQINTEVIQLLRRHVTEAQTYWDARHKLIEARGFSVKDNRATFFGCEFYYFPAFHDAMGLRLLPFLSDMIKRLEGIATKSDHVKNAGTIIQLDAGG